MSTSTSTRPQGPMNLKPLNEAGLNKARMILAAGRHIALQRAPYFASIILKFVVREVPLTPAFQTVAVTRELLLLACMEYVATLTPDTMAGDILHEALHVLERHLARLGTRDPAVWNEGADLAIYTIVRDMGVPQMSWSIQPKQYGFPEHLSADAYYALLSDRKAGDAGGAGGAGGTPAPGTGWCGSCAGRPVPGEPEAGSDPDARGSADVEVAVRDTALAIKAQAIRNRGSVPAGLLLLAEEALAPPKVPWQAQLQRAMRTACAHASGAVDYRYDAPSKRQACVGYGPGRPVLPRLRRPVPEVVFVLDTSGSMGNGEGSPLAAGCAEVLGVTKATGAHVAFLAVDAAVHASARVGTVAELLACVKGGGGTSFIPGFNAAEALRPRPSVLVYATDGEGSAPVEPPRGMRVIWLLIGKGAPVPAPWGEVVRIDEGEG